MKAGEKSNTEDPRFAEIGKIEKKEYDKLKRRAANGMQKKFNNSGLFIVLFAFTE